MSGVETIPIRWPIEYDPKFMEIIFREVLQFADVRNATGTGGITVSGSADEPAVITNDSAAASYVVLGANAELDNERILTGESTVITLTDGGAGSTITISLTANGVTLAKLQQVSTSTLLGRVTAATGDVEELTTAQGRTVLNLATTDAVAFLTVDVGTGGYLVSGTKVVGAQQAAIASLTDSTGGSATGDLVAIGDTSTVNEGSKLNDNFTEINGKLDAILAAMRTHGLIDT